MLNPRETLEALGYTQEELDAQIEYSEYSAKEQFENQELDELHEEWMQSELNWYNWARQNGYE